MLAEKAIPRSLSEALATVRSLERARIPKLRIAKKDPEFLETLDMTPTETLAHFAANIAYDDLPASTRAFTTDLLLDSIASALAGDLGDEMDPYAAFARTVGGVGDSTVIGSNETLSLIGATLLNGYMITAVSVCDSYLPAQCHISPEIVPPALAIAERDRASGRALLAAVAGGAEVATRVAAGIDYSIAGKRGWHFPGIVGPFGAAAAVGRLRNLTGRQMRNAFGLAGSQAAGTQASSGTPAVKFHQSRGAASGLLAGLLAEEDFTASAEILAHPDGGIFAAYSDGGRPEAVIDGLGKRYELEQIALRLWPGTTAAQSALTATFDLIATSAPAVEAIERVRIEVPESAHRARPVPTAPSDRFEALSSFHFMVAIVLRDGAFWLDAIDPQHVGDPDLQSFMRDRMELVANARLKIGQSRITIYLRDGTTRSSEAAAAKGAPDNPVSRDDLCRKYEKCVAGRLSKADSSELLDFLVHVDERDDLERLFTLLRSAGARH